MPRTHGLYLRTLRERRGLTQTELAVKSGVKQSHISKLENKRQPRGPNFVTVMALAQALDIDPGRLRFGPDLTPIRRRPTARRAALPSVEPEASA